MAAFSASLSTSLLRVLVLFFVGLTVVLPVVGAFPSHGAALRLASLLRS
ncbi:hypothetical protein [Phycicoccus duodecadis]|nr:hypothetical protein [Phycicoccus duodecadis]